MALLSTGPCVSIQIAHPWSQPRQEVTQILDWEHCCSFSVLKQIIHLQQKQQQQQQNFTRFHLSSTGVSSFSNQVSLCSVTALKTEFIVDISLICWSLGLQPRLWKWSIYPSPTHHFRAWLHQADLLPDTYLLLRLLLLSCFSHSPSTIKWENT